MHRVNMRLHLIVFSALGAAAVLLTGCGGTVAETMDDVRLYTSKGPQPGDEAMIVGTLALTPERCVGLEDAEGIIRAVIWPDGTKLVDNQPVRIAVDNAQELAVGDSVSGAGGYYANSDDLVAMAQECGAPEEVIRIRFE